MANHTKVYIRRNRHPMMSSAARLPMVNGTILWGTGVAPGGPGHRKTIGNNKKINKHAEKYKNIGFPYIFVLFFS